MSKVLTFSRHFPAYHPKAGQPTGFIESIVNSGVIGCPEFDTGSSIDLLKLNPNLKWQVVFEYAKTWNTTIAAFGNGKHHTIRSGDRFKAGDWFSPRVWSGKPYQSKQIIIAPDIQVKKVWDFKLTTEDDDGENDWSYINFLGKQYTCYGYGGYDDNLMVEIAKNDGLEIRDFYDWFIGKGRTSKQIDNNESKIFTGQIICWNENINY